MAAHVLFDRAGVREVDLELRVVAPLDLADQRVGLGGQSPGVEREDGDRQGVRQDQVGQHHVFGAEAVGEGELAMRAELGHGLAQQRERGGGLSAHGGAQGVGQRGLGGCVGGRGAQRGDGGVHGCTSWPLPRSTRRNSGSGSLTERW